MRLWGIIYKDGQKQRDALVELDIKKPVQLKNNEEQLLKRLTELVKMLDLELPILLKKHKNELFNFGRAVFLPADFIECVDFDRFVVEAIVDD